MAWFVECPFCHKSVFRWFYSWHQSGHTALREDGQMNEHVTLAPEQRYEGSLDGVPQAYRHAKCGVTTGMPEEIIRSYLVNPLTYNDSSFCCGCGTYVISSDLNWIETGEAVMSYMGRLRSDYVKTHFDIDPGKAEIVLTPSALVELQSIKKQMEESSFITLELIRTELDVQYKLDALPEWNRQTHDLLHLPGIDIIVKKRQRKRLSGTIVHFQESPQKGFAIGRLCLWNNA